MTLSDQVLTVLRTYWKTARPTTWLFPGRGTDGPVTWRRSQLACAEAAKACKLKKKVQLLMGHRTLTTTSRYLTGVGRGDRQGAQPARPPGALALSRPALELADIFRQHGPAYREAWKDRLPAWVCSTTNVAYSIQTLEQDQSPRHP